MAYTQGDPISAADYNNFVGEPGAGANKATVAFASEAASANKVAAMYGVGFGKYGYGQTDVTLPNVSAGDTITSAHWDGLRDALANISQHQLGSIDNDIPPASVLNVGDVIQAHDGTAGTNDNFAQAITDLGGANTAGGATARFRVAATATDAGGTDTRSSTWTGTIDTDAVCTFSSADEARYFFNAGGKIKITVAHPNGANAQDTALRGVITDVGSVEFGAETVTTDGTGSPSVASNGYWDQTNGAGFTSIVDAVNAGAPYAAVDLQVDAAVSGTTTNGSNGNVVTLRVRIVGDAADTMATGTNVVVELVRSSNLTVAGFNPTVTFSDNLNT